MRAVTGAITDIVRTVIPVIRAGGPGGFIVCETGSRPVTGIGIGAIVVGRITASRARGQIGMRTETRYTLIVGAVVTIIRTGRTVGQIGMSAGPGRIANIVGALVAVIRARGSG